MFAGALPPPDEVDWSLAQDLPDGVAPRWRDGESLRRATEERRAGRRRAILRGFLAPGFVAVLQREVAALPRIPGPGGAGTWAPVVGGLPALRELLGDPSTLALMGALLGVPLRSPPQLGVRDLPPGAAGPWRRGPTGPRLALGLGEAWRAAEGGALAFGTVGPGRAQPDPEERWLPHAGDLCLWIADPDTAWRVEPATRPRRTLRGRWVDPA